MTAAELLHSLPPRIASVVRLGGAVADGLVLVLRHDVVGGTATLEVHRPLDGPIAASGARSRAIVRIRRGDPLFVVALDGGDGPLGRAAIRAAAAQLAEDLETPLAEVPHPDDDAFHQYEAIWIWLPPGDIGA